jgi:hypothetical protein
MGIAIAAASLQMTPLVRRAGVAMALAIFAGAIFDYVVPQPSRLDNAKLARLVSGLAPHPRVLTISSHAQLGFPLTRNVSGVWVGRLMYQWITASIAQAPRKGSQDATTRDREEQYRRLEREILVGDIESKKPDVVLIENNQWKTWAFNHPDVAAALADYALVGAIGETTVYRRDLGLRPSIEPDAHK